MEARFRCLQAGVGRWALGLRAAGRWRTKQIRLDGLHNPSVSLSLSAVQRMELVSTPLRIHYKCLDRSS